MPVRTNDVSATANHLPPADGAWLPRICLPHCAPQHFARGPKLCSVQNRWGYAHLRFEFGKLPVESLLPDHCCCLLTAVIL